MIAVEMRAFIACFARWWRRASRTKCWSWTCYKQLGGRGWPAQTQLLLTSTVTSVALTTFSIKVITNLESPIQQWLLSQCLWGEPYNHTFGTHPVIIHVYSDRGENPAIIQTRSMYLTQKWLP